MPMFSATHLSTRGHGPKLKEAVDALNARNELPTWLRPVEVHRRVWDELLALGCDPKKGEFPSRTTCYRSIKIVEPSV